MFTGNRESTSPKTGELRRDLKIIYASRPPPSRSSSHRSVAGISRRQVLKLCPPLSRMIDEIRVGFLRFTSSMNFSVSL
ncbi:hypothetical protein STENM327S_05088 [Streptomyces tendae]